VSYQSDSQANSFLLKSYQRLHLKFAAHERCHLRVSEARHQESLSENTWIDATGQARGIDPGSFTQSGQGREPVLDRRTTVMEPRATQLNT